MSSRESIQGYGKICVIWKKKMPAVKDIGRSPHRWETKSSFPINFCRVRLQIMRLKTIWDALLSSPSFPQLNCWHGFWEAIPMLSAITCYLQRSGQVTRPSCSFLSDYGVLLHLREGLWP